MGDIAEWVRYQISGSHVRKSQVLADFLIELLEEGIDDSTLSSAWKLHADGSSSKHGSGVEIRLTSPMNEILEQYFRLGFRASNNESEYEALIIGKKFAHGLKIEQLHAFCDSQLVVN